MTQANSLTGYSVLKADPTQPLTATWAFTTVVPAGAGATGSQITNAAFEHERVHADRAAGHHDAGMAVYRRRLGCTSTGAEMLRIDPYDNWDVVAGVVRQTPANPSIPGQLSPLTGPTGMMYPLCGLSAGFDSSFNEQIRGSWTTRTPRRVMAKCTSPRMTPAHFAKNYTRSAARCN